MANDFIKFAFIAGELAPNIQFRGDLEKFDIGMAECRNWYIDYHGGMVTRPGTGFVEYIKDDDKPIRLYDFTFSTTDQNSYVLLFGDYYVRFIQDGSYILEGVKNVTNISNTDPAVVTSVAHGYANDDWFYLTDVDGPNELNGRLFVAKNVTTDTIQLYDTFNNPISTFASSAYVSGGKLERIYTVETPYAATDLASLKAFQIKDTIRLTSQSFVIHDLVRYDHTDWQLSETEIASTATPPTNVVVTASSGGNAGCAYAVTSVDRDGNESVASEYAYITNGEDMTTSRSTFQVSWDPVTDAAYYKVYRSIVIWQFQTKVSRAMEVGYVGRAYGPRYLDCNTIADFVSTPPLFNNPFANGKIRYINITAGGTGYLGTSVITITDPTGSGFVGACIADEITGELLAIIVLDGGHDYTNPVVSVADGTGATFTVNVGPLTGNNPAVSALFQQRQIYAATQNSPLTIWGSQPRKFKNFDMSQIVADGDSYEHEIDSAKQVMIKHLIPNRGGLLIMSELGIWQLTGSDQQGVTPTNALADPQAYNGCADVSPLTIDTDILYVEDKGYTVRLLNYKDFNKVYRGEDISILSSHLFGKDKQIEHWAYAETPNKLVVAQRSDGAMLSFTVLREQNVYAWTPWYTKGLVEDIVTIVENKVNVNYLVVKRKVNGREVKMLERMAPHEFENIEDAWCVDCGLELGHSYPEADLQVAQISGDTTTISVSADLFSVVDEGKIIRAGGGKYEITLVTGVRTADVNVLREPTKIWPEWDEVIPQKILSGDWTLDSPVSSVSGLDHLEGETVSILADGQLMTPREVIDGTVDLDFEATTVKVGLKYSCIAKSLPLTSNDTSIEARRKRVMGLGASLMNTNGLKVGQSLDSLVEFKEYTDELYGSPPRMINGVEYILIKPEWTDGGQVYFVQDNPLPATVLGFVLSAEVGDDPN